VQITIVTFKGYNEQDRLVAAGILNRMRRQGPEGVRHHTVRSGQSMNGIIIHSNRGNKRPLGSLVAYASQCQNVFVCIRAWIISPR
jgi:hypothetical protein